MGKKYHIIIVSISHQNPLTAVSSLLIIRLYGVRLHKFTKCKTECEVVKPQFFFRKWESIFPLPSKNQKPFLKKKRFLKLMSY